MAKNAHDPVMTFEEWQKGYAQAAGAHGADAEHAHFRHLEAWVERYTLADEALKETLVAIDPVRREEATRARDEALREIDLFRSADPAAPPRKLGQEIQRRKVDANDA